LLRRLEQSEGLDPAVRAAEPWAGRIVANGRLRRLLHGDATGIPLHVIYTDVPFGAWFMAQYLDLFPDQGTRRAATRLVGLGIVAAVPTALTGWAEWALADRGTRRVGMRTPRPMPSELSSLWVPGQRECMTGMRSASGWGAWAAWFSWLEECWVDICAASARKRLKGQETTQQGTRDEPCDVRVEKPLMIAAPAAPWCHQLHRG
jgi:hypothetical protein